MKILITGAGGWLGSELTEQLLAQGNEVRALNLGNSDKLDKLKLEYNNKLEIINANITEVNILDKEISRVDEVYHLAAKVHFIPTSESEKEEFYDINTNASNKIFDLCVKHKIKRVIFYSTVSVYEESNKIISIDSNKNPNTPYGDSKLKAEEYGLKLYNEKGLPITIIQPVTVYGGEDVGNFKKLEKLINKGISIVFGNGENKKTIIYYKDLITMTINIARDKSQIGKRVICGTENISINNINKVLIRNSKKKILNVRINKSFSNIIVAISKCTPLGIMKKTARRINVLMMNNTYDISKSKEYLDSYTTFNNYYKGVE